MITFNGRKLYIGFSTGVSFRPLTKKKKRKGRVDWYLPLTILLTNRTRKSISISRARLGERSGV